MSYSKTILLSIGLLSFVTDMIEFIQIISLYIFLDVKLPVNLAAVLSTFYEQINANVVPIEPPDIISNSGATFYPPSKYDLYGFDFNMLSSNFLSLAQLFLMIGYYYFLRWVFTKANCTNRLFKWLKNKFVPRMYSNVSQLILGGQMAMCFGGAAALLDRRLDHPFKLLNMSVAVTFAFVSVIIVAAHPIILKDIKRNHKEDT